LGIIFDTQLKFVDHINTKINKAYQILDINKRNFIYLTPPMTTGVGSGGYAGDLTPPTIYVGGILICISPLEKPNT